METYDVLVIGAGQAGLATGWHLQRAGVRFLLLEATERASGAWRGYYDSLELFSPAAYSGLPGLPFPGLPGHYPQRDEVVAYLEAYASHVHLPIRYRQRVQEVRRENEHFLVRTEDGTLYAARALIAASGTFGQPYTPALPGLADFKGRRLHSAEYRRPQGDEGQRVVVVGGANSGGQIACELAGVASVTLATRRPIRSRPPTRANFSAALLHARACRTLRTGAGSPRCHPSKARVPPHELESGPLLSLTLS